MSKLEEKRFAVYLDIASYDFSDIDFYSLSAAVQELLYERLQNKAIVGKYQFETTVKVK